MKTLYLERSTGECRDGSWVEALDLAGIGRIVVGTGPGSFAGIRSAIAFAQGFAMGKAGVRVYGLPSACAISGAEAVVGDARQGKIWIAKFKNGSLVGEVYQVTVEELEGEVKGLTLKSPDDRRIGAMLKEKFGEKYLGEALPTEAGLEAYAEQHPEELKEEPLPIYLNPAVRN